MLNAWAASQRSHADAREFWATFTGPVGDTLGPILSTLAILVTVFVAVLWQPRQTRAEWESQQEQNRASRVDGWIVESTDGRRLGVVVANDADAAVFDLDLIVADETDSLETTGLEVGMDREFKLPRGTWFIEFVFSDRMPLRWRAPVPVRVSDGMEVQLDPLEGDRVTRPQQHVLRPHVPQPARAYFVLREMRFSLHDVAWQRDDRGRPILAKPLKDDEEARREAAGASVRQEQRDRTISSARVDEPLESLLRYVIESLCRTQYPDIEDLYAAAIRNELRVDADLLPGVASIMRPSAGGQLHIALAHPRGSRLKLVPSGGVFPQAVFLQDASSQSVFTIDGKKAGGPIKRAGARAIGGENGGDLTARTSAQWMSSEAERWKLILALRLMVEEASRAQENAAL
ncbi:hypothetical protein ACI3KS_06450 [Microbacterium sp. ZW T5_45]|uniref:hypothetical protein n=1 Tax=Microbacterium sp. ZW T5_45 TaxID=3378080 RepID=UPI0038553F58